MKAAATSDELATRVENLVRLIRPILAGEDPIAVSAVLADLTAMLLAGYQGRDVDVTKIRAQLLAKHVQLIRDLVTVNELELADRINASLETRKRGVK